MALPNRTVDTFAGDAGVAYEIELSSQYMSNQIVISSGGSGDIEVKAKPELGVSFEQVDGGIIDLSVSRTLVIEGYQLKALSVTQTATAPFTVKVIQTDSVGVF